jgi:hypothetical protein
MLHITLRGHLCDIIVLNVFAPTEDKSDDMKDSFYKDLEIVLYCIVLYRIGLCPEVPHENQEIIYEDLKWVELIQDLIQRWTLVLPALKPRVLRSEYN